MMLTHSDVTYERNHPTLPNGSATSAEPVLPHRREPARIRIGKERIDELLSDLLGKISSSYRPEHSTK